MQHELERPFDPTFMLNNDPGARVTLTSQVSDPQGLNDFLEPATDELIEGMLEKDANVLPTYFNAPAHDDGVYPAIPVDEAFLCGFETGDTSEWSSVVP